MIVLISGRSSPEILAETGRHGLRLQAEEWLDLVQRLGRDPTLAEAFLFDVAWSEHCSYKSSRSLLKQYLPPLASHVLLGPGEDSGIASLGHWNGQEWALVVAHESHNHPSQVLPVEGAATGIGGIVRDVYCMGADVVGVLDGLRFGDPDGSSAARVRAIARGVVQGISEYGNALGVPNLGGDLVFHEGFDDNCLVNVVAFGVMPRHRIIRSRVPEQARREPYLLVLVGKPTDDTGLGGASFASVILDEAEAGGNRGAVQIHDPFLKRVLAEATREALDWIQRESIPVGCKDLGAGGLGGASSELALAGGFGAEIDLSAVPQGLHDLEAHHVLCAETQERFVWAIPERRVEEFCRVFNRDFELDRIYPGAAAAVIGRVIEEPVYRCLWGGKTVVEVPNRILENPPGLSRPRTPRKSRPPEVDPPAPEEWTRWVVGQLTSWNAVSRAPVFRSYDQEVRGEAFLRPGEADAGVSRPVPGASLGIAVSLDGNPHYGVLDPYWAGALAVLESARNVAAVGARPLVLTDCLNFGSPEDPQCLWDFEQTLRGMADACHAVGSPQNPEEPLSLISGNVSFYNQSAAGRAIAPSPVVCCWGLLEDYGRAVTPRLKRAGNRLLLTGRRARAWGRPRSENGGRVPRPDLQSEARTLRAILALAEEGRLRACHDVSDGGCLRALWEMSALEEGPGPLGFEIDLDTVPQVGETSLDALAGHELLLSETPGFLFEVDPDFAGEAAQQLTQCGVTAAVIGTVLETPRLRVLQSGNVLFDLAAEEVHPVWRERLEQFLRSDDSPATDRKRED